MRAALILKLDPFLPLSTAQHIQTRPDSERLRTHRSNPPHSTGVRTPQHPRPEFESPPRLPPRAARPLLDPVPNSNYSNAMMQLQTDPNPGVQNLNRPHCVGCQYKLHSRAV